MAQQNFHEKNFFLLTAIIVVMLGIPTLYSIFNEPSIQPAVALVSEPTNRGPASVDGSLSAAANSITVDVSCADIPNSLVVFGAHMRLKSKECRDYDVSSLSVVNRSNGFTASIFPTRDNQFTTDYIDLAEGDNSIEMKIRDSSGSEKTHSIKIVKRAPASSSQ